MVAMFGGQDDPVELFSYINPFFCSNLLAEMLATTNKNAL